MKSPILISLAVALSAIPAITAFAAPESVAVFAQAVGLAPATIKAWGFDKSDITPDPAVRYGVLPNGMKFAIMKNSTPQHAASIRLRFDVGSTAEAQDQQGLAHFLEHMAFNGSKRVPEGEMVKLLERNGLAFGADTNASTGLSQTIYKLDLPQVNDALVDTSLMLMRETASELLLDKGAMDRERGVIMGEMRARDNFAERLGKDQLEFLVPHTPISDHQTIGTEAVIKGAPVERLRDLYETFYTPERATLIIVGDIDPDQIEAKIIKQFGDWRGKRKFDGDPLKGNIDIKRPFTTRFFVDPDVSTGISINALKPFDARPDSAAKRRESTLENLANAMLSRRLQKLSRLTDAPFTSGIASSVNLLSTTEIASIDMDARDRDWKRALASGEQELRRVLRFGFTAGELNEQMSNIRTALKNGADQATTRKSAGLAESLANSVEVDQVFSTPQSALDRFESYASKITVDDVNTAFRALWNGVEPLVHVANNAAIPNGDTEIATVWKTSSAVAVMPPASNDNKAFAHTNFGPAGLVASDSRIVDFGIRTVKFANNVRLNLKKTDFEKGKVRVSLRVGGGMLELPRQYDGLGSFMAVAFPLGGTSQHSADEMQSILSGRNVGSGLMPDTDAFSAVRTTTPADLELQLQVLAANVTAPGYRSEAEAQWRNVVGVFMQQVESQPQAVAALRLPRVLASGDPMFGIPDEATLKARNFAELKPALAQSFANGPIEIGIVGDIDEAQAIALVAKTFGALPARAAVRPDYTKGRAVHFPADRKPITLFHSGKPEQALAQVYWSTTDGLDFKQALRLELLGEVMGIMATEELREKMGATYSPNASSTASETFRGYGYLSISSTTEPKLIDAIFAGVDTISAALVAKPISEDLLKRARAPMLERLARNQRENGFWINFVDEAQTKPSDLGNLRTWNSTLSGITAKDLQAEAKRWLKPGAALRVRVIPKR
jgi:zinc protease